MKKSVPVILCLLLAAAPLFSQEQLELFGYFESQIMGADINNDFIQLYSNKLRIDLKSELSDAITFAANFNYITYHGKTEWNVLDFLSPSIRERVPQALAPFYTISFTDRHYLDNAYMKLSIGRFDLTAGKQQISPGTGYVWNPTDLFNAKDLLDPTYEQPGHNALRLDMTLGADFTLTGLYSPEKTWGGSAKMLEFKGRISHFDYAFIGVEKTWLFHNYNIVDFKNMIFPKSFEKRSLLGGSLAGELLGFGVWAEYGYNWMEITDNFSELVLGVDYTFDFQTYFMLEFYRNSMGKTASDEYTINDWMRMLAAEQKTITRDQVYAFLQHPLTDLIQAGVSSIYSISDGSLALIPTLNYSLSDNVELLAYLNLYLGKAGTVYAKNMGSGGLIRLRVYF